MIVVRIDNIMKDIVDFRFVVQIECIMIKQSLRMYRSTDTRLWTKFRIANKIKQNFHPGIMTRNIIVIIWRDLFQLKTNNIHR
jgi:hypothetical protein